MEDELWRVPLTARAQGVAPAGDEALGASGCTGGGQRYGGHPRIEDSRRGQLDEHDVIVQGPAAIFGVADDLGRVDELLIPLVDLDVVLSEPHLDAAVGKTSMGRPFFSICPLFSRVLEHPTHKWECGRITWQERGSGSVQG